MRVAPQDLNQREHEEGSRSQATAISRQEIEVRRDAQEGDDLGAKNEAPAGQRQSGCDHEPARQGTLASARRRNESKGAKDDEGLYDRQQPSPADLEQRPANGLEEPLVVDEDVPGIWANEYVGVRESVLQDPAPRSRPQRDARRGGSWATGQGSWWGA